jgi:hypothetical protein
MCDYRWDGRRRTGGVVYNTRHVLPPNDRLWHNLRLNHNYKPISIGLFVSQSGPFPAPAARHARLLWRVLRLINDGGGGAEILSKCPTRAACGLGCRAPSAPGPRQSVDQLCRTAVPAGYSNSDVPMMKPANDFVACSSTRSLHLTGNIRCSYGVPGHMT